MEINLNKITDVFGYGEVATIARNVFNRIDDEEIADMLQAIIDAVDAELIYTADQWAVIAYYSEPDAPMAFDEAVQSFINDLVEVA